MAFFVHPIFQQFISVIYIMRDNSSNREGNVLWIFHFCIYTPCGKIHSNDKGATKKEQVLNLIFLIYIYVFKISSITKIPLNLIKKFQHTLLLWFPTYISQKEYIRSSYLMHVNVHGYMHMRALGLQEYNQWTIWLQNDLQECVSKCNSSWMCSY